MCLQNALQRESDAGSAFGFLLEGATASSGASDTHKYYRWRVYSLSQGDSLQKWRTAPFQMVEGGPFWVPPMLMVPATIAQPPFVLRLAVVQRDE